MPTNNIETYTENIIIQFSWNFLYANAKTMNRKASIFPDGELLDKGYIIPEKGSQLEDCLKKLSYVSPVNYVNDLDVEERITESKNKKLKKLKSGTFKLKLNYTPYLEWKINGLTMELISLLLENGYLKVCENTEYSTDIKNILPVLETLITQPESKLSLEEAAKITCMSYSNFSRTFKKLTGYNYIEYCNIWRIQLAEELLISSDLSVTEIANRLNFGCINYFNRVFKKFNGDTPTQFRKKFGRENNLKPSLI